MPRYAAANDPKKLTPKERCLILEHYLLFNSFPSDIEACRIYRVVNAAKSGRRAHDIDLQYAYKVIAPGLSAGQYDEILGR